MTRPRRLTVNAAATRRDFHGRQLARAATRLFVGTDPRDAVRYYSRSCRRSRAVARYFFARGYSGGPLC